MNTRRPTISGRAELGQQLRVEPGRWSGTQPITYTYQWLRCDNRGDNCVTQPGFVDDNYAVREGDIGKRPRVRVTASFDNSADNPLNPDPSAWVHDGPLTTDEMMSLVVEWIRPRVSE